MADAQRTQAEEFAVFMFGWDGLIVDSVEPPVDPKVRYVSLARLGITPEQLREMVTFVEANTPYRVAPHVVRGMLEATDG